MLKLSHRFLIGRQGATAIEYGLITALISIGIVTFLQVIGVDVAGFFTSVNEGL